MTPSTKFAIEEFDAQRHDRSSFSSGVDSVDNYLKLTANKLGKSGYAKVFVMVDGAALVGYHAINVHSVMYTALPKRYERDRPRHGLIPAGYISMLGIDRRYAGQRLGTTLLMDAIARMVIVSQHIGLAVIVLDVLDDGDPERVGRRVSLYERFGFTAMPSSPLTMFLPISTARALVAEA